MGNWNACLYVRVCLRLWDKREVELKECDGRVTVSWLDMQIEKQLMYYGTVSLPITT